MKPLPIPVKLFGGVGLALAILGATAFASWRSLQLLLEAQDLVTHTREVIAGVERLLVETLDTQTGARGFVITGDEAFLEPFHAAQAALPGRLAALRKLTADYAVQQRRLDELDRLSRARQEIASQIIQTRRERGFDSAALTPLVRRGKETMDEIRQVVRAMKRDEESLLAQRNAEARRRAERTLLTILVGGAAGFGLVGFASFRSYQEIQARQRAEADARRAAAEVEDLYNNAPCGYCSVDADGVVRAINNTELEMLGYAREEVVGRKRITELLTPASGEEFRRRFPEYVRAGRIADVEFEYVRKDGSTFTGLLSSTAVKDGQGNFVRSRSTVLDITARKQAEAERDRFFHISLDLLGIASATDGRFVRVSPGVTDLLGWSPEEFLAQPYMELIHPDDRAASQAEVERQTVRGEKVLHFENRFRHKDGSWRVLSWRSVPQPGGLMYATARDITERKRMEQELRELNERLEHRVAERTAELAAAEARFRTLVEQSLVGIYVIHGDRFTYVNPRMAELLGFTAEEMTRRPLLEFIVAEDRPLAAENVRRRLSGEVPSAHYQLRLVRQDRTVIHAEVHGARCDLNGRPAIMGTLLDITERKLAEEKLRQFAARLARSNRELQDFAFVASHDLQEPLRKIQAFSDRLKLKCGPALDDTGRDYLARMTDAAARMRRLIDDLLMFSRVTSKAKPFEPVDLAAIAHTVVSDLEIRLEQTGGKVEVGPLPTLDADPTQMRQLLQNLIGNALKFRRPEVPPLVAVWGDRQDGHVRLSVADNGIGFDEKYTDRIFQVFQRLHGRAEYEGSGIGLAVCRKIAERHGGGISARSTPGVGSTFTVTLPLQQPNANPAHEPHA
jgi:PAS domain S-box-containing protein